jgi:hypothetical protein
LGSVKLIIDVNYVISPSSLMAESYFGLPPRRARYKGPAGATRQCRKL